MPLGELSYRNEVVHSHILVVRAVQKYKILLWKVGHSVGDLNSILALTGEDIKCLGGLSGEETALCHLQSSVFRIVVVCGFGSEVHLRERPVKLDGLCQRALNLKGLDSVEGVTLLVVGHTVVVDTDCLVGHINAIIRVAVLCSPEDEVVGLTLDEFEVHRRAEMYFLICVQASNVSVWSALIVVIHIDIESVSRCSVANGSCLKLRDFRNE